MNRALTLLSVLLLNAAANADDGQEISFNDVPQNILDMANATAPGVTFDRVSIEVENGVSIYEFEAKDHNGLHIEIDVTENGELEEIEMETPWENVPEPVVATLKKTAPGFKPTYIELSVREGGAKFVYEFEGTLEGRPVDIEIAENGKLLVFEDTLSS